MDRIRPIKSLGQNFLTDKNVILKIIDTLDIQPDDNILEIGPGSGALTEYICGKCNYLGVEIDSRAFNLLDDKYSNEKTKFLNLDILNFNFEDYYQDSNFKVIGNLPYYITSPIIFQIFQLKYQPKSAIFMVQKEVGERLFGKKHTKSNGILSIMSSYVGKVEKLFDVSPNCFFPKPKVWSSIIKFEFEKKFDLNFKEFLMFVKTAFNQRRKVLSNSLKSYGELPEEIRGLRAENLDVNEFVDLFKRTVKK